MTLANFNSNFNWQLRMLKESAECCGIIPPVPPTPPPPCTSCIADPPVDFSGLVTVDNSIPRWGFGTQQISGICFPIYFTWDYVSTTTTIYYRVDNTAPTLDPAIPPSGQGFTAAPAGAITGSITADQWLTIGMESTIDETVALNLVYECNGNPGFTLNKFDVTSTGTPVPQCLYVGFFDPVGSGSGYSNLSGWTLNGNDMITELTSLTTGQAGNIWVGYMNGGGYIFYGTWFYYYGPDVGQLDFIAPDSSVYPYLMTPVTAAGYSCDTLQCFKIETPAGSPTWLMDYVYFATTLFGISAAFTSSPPFYTALYSNDSGPLTTLFQLIYGPQCSVTTTYNPVNDSDVIVILDAFDFGPPSLSDGVNTVVGVYDPICGGARCAGSEPILSVSGNVTCTTKPAIPATVTVENLQPGQVTTYTWSLDNKVVSETNELYFDNPQPGNTTYVVTATNDLGCITTQSVIVYGFFKPNFTTSITSASECSVSGTPPSVGDGQIVVTLDFPDGSVSYYEYILTYSTGTPYPGYSETSTDTLPFYVWSALCPGDYILSVNMYAAVGDAVILVCTSEIVTVTV